MADYIVYRFAGLNVPNSMNGAWVEEGIARDLKADESAKALKQCADPSYPDAIRRVHRWDTTEEYDAKPSSGPDFKKREKGSEA